MHIMLLFEVQKCSKLNTIVFYHLVSVECIVTLVTGPNTFNLDVALWFISMKILLLSMFILDKVDKKVGETYYLEKWLEFLVVLCY